MLLRSFQVESIILNMEVSIFLVIATESVAQGSGFFFYYLVCGGGPDAEGADLRATTSWVSKPSLPYESVHPSCWRAAHFHGFIMCSRISHSRPLALTQYDITVSAEYFEFSWQLINLGQSFQTPALTVWRKGNLVLSM